MNENNCLKCIRWLDIYNNINIFNLDNNIDNNNIVEITELYKKNIDSIIGLYYDYYDQENNHESDYYVCRKLPYICVKILHDKMKKITQLYPSNKYFENVLLTLSTAFQKDCKPKDWKIYFHICSSELELFLNESKADLLSKNFSTIQLS